MRLSFFAPGRIDSRGEAYYHFKKEGLRRCFLRSAAERSVLPSDGRGETGCVSQGGGRLENFILTVDAVVPMFLLIAAGYLAQKLGVLTRADVPRVNRLAFRIFLPCQLFYNIYSSNLHGAFHPGLMAFTVCGVCLVTAAAVQGVRRFETIQERKGVVAQGIFRSNFVIMGLPIAQALVGKDNLAPVAILIAVVVPMFNFFAVFVLERFRGMHVRTIAVLKEVIKNPLIIGSLIGILFQLLHLRLPALLEGTVSSLGSIATPLQLFLLGAFFRFDGLKRYLRPLTAVTLIKLLLIPGIMLGSAAALGFRGANFVGLIGIFGSPTAVNSFTMVQQMDCGDAELAGDIVVATSAFSIFSFFGWIWLFKSLGVF